MVYSKAALRPMQKERLKDLVKQQPEKKRQQEQVLYEKLFTSSYWMRARTLAITSSLSFEMDTKPIIKKAWQEGKSVYLAKVEKEHQLSFRFFTSETSLTPAGSFGLLEPENTNRIKKWDIDLIIVPALAFNLENHHRLGFGGGYYDRFLSDFNGDSVGLVMEEQTGFSWPSDSNDVPVKYLIK